MSTLPQPIHSTTSAIYRHYEETADDGLRKHLGASIIGHPCDRHLWYVFRWGAYSKFEGRLLRLFQTGQLEENRIVENLKAIGCEVHQVDTDGRQFTFSSINGHFGGSMDACAKGLPESPKKWHVVEMKTHSEKSFNELLKKGVQSSKPLHYAQMQVYMGLSGMERALYFAVNKNTDDIYTERVRFDKDFFKSILDRAERIINAPIPPLGISQNPSWYECKLCTFYDLCHKQAIPPPTCRSCAHSTPVAGKWQCERNQHEIFIGQQKAGCSDHRYIPILLERTATQIDGSDEENWVKYKNNLSGHEFINGEHGFGSQELYSCKDKTALGQPIVQSFLDTLNAEVTG